MQGLGFPFAPEVAFMYNSSSTAIGKGETVLWGSTGATAVVAIDWPEPDMSGGRRDQLASQANRTITTTINVPGIARQTAAPLAKGRAPMGVAMEAIGITSWGHICLSGMTDVMIGISSDIAVGDSLVTTAGARFIEVSSADSETATAIYAMALEATLTSGACAAALISAFIPAGWSFNDTSMGRSTA